MELKKMIKVLCITIITISIISFSGSYAWYAYNNAETKIIASTSKEKPVVIFAQNEFIKINNLIPILDGDKYNYASKNTFTITLGNNLKKYDTGVEITLKDVSMSDELRIENFKYELVSNNKIISSGNFKDTENITSILLMPMTELETDVYPKSYVYELYIWLSDNGSNQNELMNKTFSARVNVDSFVKSKD